MPEIINVDIGIVELPLKGFDTVSVYFNPTDTNFLDRLLKTFDLLENLGKEHKEEVKKADDKDVFAVDRKYDAEMRKCLNDVFEKEVCTPIFGSMNVFSSLGSGAPVWFNLIELALDVVKEKFAEEEKAIDPRIEKFVAKYRRK